MRHPELSEHLEQDGIDGDLNDLFRSRTAAGNKALNDLIDLADGDVQDDDDSDYDPFEPDDDYSDADEPPTKRRKPNSTLSEPAQTDPEAIDC